MSSVVQAVPRPRSWLFRTIVKPGNVLPAAAWLFLVFSQAFNSPFPPSLSTALLRPEELAP